MKTPKKKNFLSNKELLSEIHKSKNTYCWFRDEDAHSDYDFTVENIFDFDINDIDVAKENRLNRINKKIKENNKDNGTKDPLLSLEDINTEDIVIRAMEWDHVPFALDGEVRSKVNNERIKINFRPFKHYTVNITNDELTFEEVGRSHWLGGKDNGYFSQDHGKTTNMLARMYMLLVERYSLKPNWRNYSYLDEMKSHTLMQLSNVGLKFDETRSQNPFAYFTAIMSNGFTGILNNEKKIQNLRDDILLMHGHNPSNSKMLEHELSNMIVPKSMNNPRKNKNM